jgi:EAL domain-containing protein (putative c-di-GMP-specific phosphodiesterase class I)
VIALSDERCVGAEALVRWRRESQIIPPGEFIPLIENTPVSGLVTYWVIETVAKDLAAWLRTQDDVHIAINVPPEVFGRGGLAYAAGKAQILDIISKFVFEVTERGIPDELGVSALNYLHRHRILVALDDVCASDTGAQIASRVRVDILKIEKATVDRITQRKLSPVETSAIAALIRASHTLVVAEGVEDASQAVKLRECGIGLAQGWLFSHPLSADAFKAYFSSHH